MTSILLRGTGKAAVIIISSAAKVGWATTKFGAKDMAGPTAKFTLTKVAPKAALYMLKSTGIGAKYALPWAIKLSLL